MNLNYKIEIDLGIDVTSDTHNIVDGKMYLSYSADTITGYTNDMIIKISSIENSVDLTKGGGCELYNTARITLRNQNNWVYYARNQGCKFFGNQVTITAVKNGVDQLLYIGGISEITNDNYEVDITTDDINQFIYDIEASNEIPKSVYNTLGSTEINNIRLLPQLEPFSILNFYDNPGYRHEMSNIDAKKAPSGTQNVKNGFGSTLSNLSNVMTVTRILHPIYTSAYEIPAVHDEDAVGLIICDSVISTADYSVLGFPTITDFVTFLSDGWDVNLLGMPRLAKILADGTLDKIIPLRGSAVNDYAYVDTTLHNVFGATLNSAGYVTFFFSVFVPIDDISVGDTLCLTENHTVQNIDSDVDLITTSNFFDSDYYDNSGYNNNFKFKNRTSSYNLCDVVKDEYQDTVDLTEQVRPRSNGAEGVVWETVGFALTEAGPFVGNSFSNSIHTIGAATGTAPITTNLQIDEITRSNVRVIGANNTGGSSETATYMSHKVSIPLDSSIIPLDLTQLENFKFCFSMGDFSAESNSHIGFVHGGKFANDDVLPPTKIKIVKTRSNDYVSETILATWTKDTTSDLVDARTIELWDEPFTTAVKSVNDENIYGYVNNTHNFLTTILSNDNRELSYPNLNNKPSALDFERALYTNSTINAWEYTAGEFNGYINSDDSEYHLVVEFNTGLNISVFYDPNITQYFSLNFAGISNVLDVNDLNLSAYTNDDQYDFNYIPANMLNEVGLIDDIKLSEYKNTGFNLTYDLPTKFSSSFVNGLNNNFDSVFTIISNICKNTPSKIISTMTGDINILNLFNLIGESLHIDHVITNFGNIKSDYSTGTGTKINFVDGNSNLNSTILDNHLPIEINPDYAKKLGLLSVNEVFSSLYQATNYQEIITSLDYKSTNVLTLTLEWFALNSGDQDSVNNIITNLYNYLGDYLLYLGDKERISFNISMNDYLEHGYNIGDIVQLNDGVIYNDDYLMIAMISSIAINDVESNSVNIQCIKTIQSGDIIANYFFDPLSGESPLSVTFTDESLGADAISWNWSYSTSETPNTFISFSNIQNPTQIFDDGIYNIRLSVSSVDSTSVKTEINAIKVGSSYVLNADFTSDVTSGEAPLEVQFTDTSTGSPDSWDWKIDGLTFSTLQNPSHTFNPYAGDFFDITLTVTNGDSSSTKTYIDYIEVNTYSILTNDDDNLYTNEE